MLSWDQRKALLHAAREAIRSKLLDNDSPSAPISEAGILESRGAFVSIHVGEELRGCIGVIEPLRPLLETVISCAISAATEDPRFPSLSLGELHEARLEISVLSSPREIRSVEELQIGRDGVIVSGGDRKAILLPQVATREGWGAEQFVSAACRKAGLASEAWRGGGVKLEAFTAEVFGEEP